MLLGFCISAPCEWEMWWCISKMVILWALCLYLGNLNYRPHYRVDNQGCWDFTWYLGFFSAGSLKALLKRMATEWALNKHSIKRTVNLACKWWNWNVRKVSDDGWIIYIGSWPNVDSALTLIQYTGWAWVISAVNIATVELKYKATINQINCFCNSLSFASYLKLNAFFW